MSAAKSLACPARIVAALTVLAIAAVGWTSCQQAPAARSPLGTDALAPSPRLIVGRIIAVDRAQSLAVVELGTDAPPAALGAGNELIVRTLDLRETGRLRASRYVRGRTLGATIVGGQPSPGDEVVWLAP